MTKTLILTHCHFGCIRSQNWVCPVYVTIKTVCANKSSYLPWSLHTGSMLSLPQCLRGSSTSGPPFKWSHCPTVPGNIPLQCSVWGNTSFHVSWAACLCPSSLTTQAPGVLPWQSREMAWDNFEVSVIFCKWHCWYQEENQIISLLPFIGGPLFLLDQTSSLSFSLPLHLSLSVHLCKG